jgi:phytoene dehydrogenase-like protein
MMGKRVIILGGGISGLSAGIYGQMHGFDTEVYEKQAIPGGECTGWDRKGFHIDGCIHWLTGSKEGTSMGKMWREIGALGPDVEIYYPDSFCTAEVDGITVNLYRDLDKLHKHLLDLSPEDKEEIDILCKAIGKVSDSGIPVVPPETMNPLDILKMVVKMSGTMGIMKNFSMSLSEYVKRFRHPAVQKALLSILPGDTMAYVLPFTLGNMCSGNDGRPAGGSRALALRAASRYKSLGGKLHLGKEVSRIRVESGRAVGVTLADGTEISADFVVPATDIHTTLSRFLEGKYPNPEIEKRDADHSKYPTPTCVYASFGIDADLSDDVPADFMFEVSPYIYEDKKCNTISFKHYCYEPSFAPAGKSVVVVFLDGDYDWWKNKSSNPEEYKREKERLANALCSALEERFPHLIGKIMLLDIATPVTYERYCDAWRGSWMSYGQTPGTKQMMDTGRIKGIDNLFMAGQWLMSPGGLPVAVVTGKWAIQRICKQEKLPWRW